MCRLVVILGDQLTFDNPVLKDFDPLTDHIVMAEVVEESTHVWSHPQRIVLFLSAMRHFAQTLQAQGFSLTYFELEKHRFSTLSEIWQQTISIQQPQSVRVCEPGDWRVLQQLISVCRSHALPLNILPDHHFMCSTQQFKKWAAKYDQTQASLRMEFFYRAMRKKYSILMHEEVPEGGVWNFDHENRKALSADKVGHIPAAKQFVPDATTHAVIQLVRQRFASHPGALDSFGWPVTRDQALQLLHDFIAYKLPNFGPYQDAMWQGQAYLWHSMLSSSLNLKLLNPREVIHAAEAAYHAGCVPLESAEGFIRQILGWREFVRGVYWREMPSLKSANFFQHNNDLPAWFWTGETHMHCLAQCIRQTLETGYAHHIQRLMVIGLFGLLAELSPQQVADWFLAVYVDAVEWVELPNVAGMALFANGGRFTSKPYIASGAYIRRMSNYCQSCRYQPELKTGEKACPFTSFYWAFLIKHAALLNQNTRMKLMLKHVDKLDDEAKTAILAFAQQQRGRLAAL